MNIRRTSGEIVNATLLETFLALVFLIFGLALVESKRAEVAEAASKESLSPASADSLRRQVAEGKRLAADQAIRLRRATAVGDSLRGILIGKYPPDCEPNAVPAALLTMKFIGQDQIRVVPNRNVFGMSSGTVIDLTARSFLAQFAGARKASLAQKCRYRVTVEDTKATSKDEFKSLLGLVQTVFRAQGYLR